MVTESGQALGYGVIRNGQVVWTRFATPYYPFGGSYGPGVGGTSIVPYGPTSIVPYGGQLGLNFDRALRRRRSTGRRYGPRAPGTNRLSSANFRYWLVAIRARARSTATTRAHPFAATIRADPVAVDGWHMSLIRADAEYTGSLSLRSPGSQQLTPRACVSCNPACRHPRRNSRNLQPFAREPSVASFLETAGTPEHMLDPLAAI